MAEIAAESALCGATGAHVGGSASRTRRRRPETGTETRFLPPRWRSDGVRRRLRPPRSGVRVGFCWHVAEKAAVGSRGEPSEHVDERVGDAAVPSEPQVRYASVAADNRRDVHEVEDHGPQPEPASPSRRERPAGGERGLADAAQDVERERGEGEDEFVRLEFPAGEPLHVHVGLELAVELLARRVVVVEPHDGLRVVRQVRPPRCDRVLGEELALARRAPHLPDAEERPVRRALRADVRDDAAEDVDARAVRLAVGFIPL